MFQAKNDVWILLTFVQLSRTDFAIVPSSYLEYLREEPLSYLYSAEVLHVVERGERRADGAAGQGNADHGGRDARGRRSLQFGVF